jgi:hypothetical protein
MSANIVSIDRLLRRSRDWSSQELAEARALTDGDHKATDDKVNDGRARTIRFAGSKGPENANAAAMLNAAGHAAIVMAIITAIQATSGEHEQDPSQAALVGVPPDASDLLLKAASVI